MLRISAALLELEARVDVLGVLAHGDAIEVVAQVARSLVSLHRAHERVEVEGLPQRHVDAAKAAAYGRGDRSLQRHLVLADRFQHRLRERRTELSDRRLAGLLHVPLELDTRGLEDAHRGVADLGANAVARDERYGVLGQSGEGSVEPVLPVLELVGDDLDEVAPLLWPFVVRLDL